MVINHNIILDVARPNDRTVIQAKQNDVNSRTVTVSLYNNGEALTVPQDCGVVVNALRPDGQTNGWAGAVLEDGSVLVPLVSWLLEAEGYGSLSVSVISPARERLTSFSFNSYTQTVEWTGAGIEDDPNYDVLLTLIADTEAAKAGALAAALAAQNAEAAATEAAGAANDAADRAETASANASTAATAAQTATAEANAAIAAVFEMLEQSDDYLHEQVDTAVEAAEDATAAANAAAELAAGKAALADEKAAAAHTAAALADEKAGEATTAAGSANAAAALADERAGVATAAAARATEKTALAEEKAALANTAAALANEKAALAQEKATAADTAALAASAAASAADTAREAIQGDLSAIGGRLDTLEASDAETDKLKTGAAGIIPVPIATAKDLIDNGIIRWSNGAINSSSAASYTDYVSVDGMTAIVYTRRVTTGSSAPANGMAFYDASKNYISGLASAYGAQEPTAIMQRIDVPTGAMYARFTYYKSNDAVYSDIPFAVYDAAEYDAIRNNASGYFPVYTGKRFSIIGDSISTYVNAAEKVQVGSLYYSPDGCTTNYPGYPVRYAYSNVTAVGDTWWSKVIQRCGGKLGINESLSGSMISWDGTTETYKFGSDKCFASEARIGHLDDNGTPDVILIFGGTNDIYHYKEMGIPIGTLDTTHDPFDYENFPMVTNTIYGAVTTMLLRMQHTYPNAQLLFVVPYYCVMNTSAATANDVDLVDNAIINVCNYLGVDYVDLRKTINFYDISSLTFDNVHPNAAGMDAIANDVLLKLYGAKSSGTVVRNASGGDYELPAATADTLGGVKVAATNTVIADENGRLEVNLFPVDWKAVGALLIASLFAYGDGVELLIDNGKYSDEELQRLFEDKNMMLIDGNSTSFLFVPARSGYLTLLDENYDEHRQYISKSVLLLLQMQNGVLTQRLCSGESLRELLISGL